MSAQLEPIGILTFHHRADGVWARDEAGRSFKVAFDPEPRSDTPAGFLGMTVGETGERLCAKQPVCVIFDPSELRGQSA